MNKSQQTALRAKIMAVPGMDLDNDAGYQLDESPARDLHRTHIRFTSDGGLSDHHNGNTFTKYLREQGVSVEQRLAKLVVVENSVLTKVFGV